MPNILRPRVLQCMAWGCLVLLLLIACGQTGPILTAAPMPPGWQPVQQLGMTLALPPAWQVITADQIDAPGTLQALGDANPGLRPTLEQAKQLFSTGHVRLMAFDLDPAQAALGFTTNLTLGVVPAQGASLPQLRTANLNQLHATPNFATLSDAASKVAGLSAVELNYTMNMQAAGSPSTALRVNQYLWLYNDMQYVATFTTTPDQAKALTPTFRQMLDTVRMTK